MSQSSNSKPQKKPATPGREKLTCRRTKENLQNKQFKCDPNCGKEFNDYSSLYTHIKIAHQGKANGDMQRLVMKKKEVIEHLKNIKGEKDNDKKYQVEIEDLVLHFFNQERLLETYLLLEQCIKKDSQQLSLCFHPEDCDCLELDPQKYPDKNFQHIFYDQVMKEIVLQYIKPLTEECAVDVLKLLNHLFAQREKMPDWSQKQQYIEKKLRKKNKKYPVLQQLIEKEVSVYFKTLIENLIECHNTYKPQ